MTNIRLQDNSTEEDDASPEHYDRILPVSIAGDSDYDFDPGVLRHVTPTLRGKEAYSDAKEDLHSWPHPWVSIPALTQTATISRLAPKNMFGRSVEEVLRSPDIPPPSPPSSDPLPLPASYSSVRPSTSVCPSISPAIVADRSQGDHRTSSSLDVGIEEVRRNLGAGLHLAGNFQRTADPIAPAPFSLTGRDLLVQPTAQPSSPLTAATNQEGLGEDPNTRRALPFLPAPSNGGSVPSSEPSPSPLEEPCLLTHSSTQQIIVPVVSGTSPGLIESLEGRLENSPANIGQKCSTSISSGDEGGGSDQEVQEKPKEQGKPSRHSRKRKDKGKSHRYPCPEPWCDKTFSRSNDAQRHYLNASGHKLANRDTSTCCQKCGEELSRPDARRRHERKGSCGKRKINRKPPHPLAAVDSLRIK